MITFSTYGGIREDGERITTGHQIVIESESPVLIIKPDGTIKLNGRQITEEELIQVLLNNKP